MTREELIAVELKDGTICRMAKKALNIFLSHDRVAKFKRADGWVVVGTDPLRAMNSSNHFSGFDRRAPV